MPLVTTEEMFRNAKEKGYAIGAFNINNMEIIQGIVDAAYELNSPVILQVSSSALEYARPLYLKHMVEAAIEETGLPIALHLDHGANFDICKECVDLGFTSVMIDASKYDFEENVAITKKVVEYAHSKGVVVEAELGKLAGIEDNVKVDEKDSAYTDPDQALEFVERTGCDSLAVAIGTSHGAYKFKGDAELKFDVLQKIVAKLPMYFPLVLHGASSVLPEYVERCNQSGGNIPGAKGVPHDMLRKAASLGICKINMDTDLRLAMTVAIREQFLKDPAVIDPRKYLGSARNLITELVMDKIKNALGSENSL